MAIPINFLLLKENEHIYWILDLENQVHSIWVVWPSIMQEPGQGWRVVAHVLSMLPAVRRPNMCNARRGYLERPKKIGYMIKYDRYCKLNNRHD
jgi:hypothetical protein